MRYAKSLFVLSRLLSPRTMRALTWGDVDLPRSGNVDTAVATFHSSSGVSYRGQGRDLFLALRTLKRWGGDNRPAPESPLVVATPESGIAATRSWIEGVSRLCAESDGPTDAQVANVRGYIRWLATAAGMSPTRAEREGLSVLTWLAAVGDADRLPLNRGVESRWSAYSAGAAQPPALRRGPPPIGSVDSDGGPLVGLLPGFRVALESGTLIQPPPAPGTAANYAHTLRLILRHVAGDPTEDRIVVAALRSYGRLRSPREAWSAFRLYAGERGLDLPEYPYSRIAAERTKRQPTRRASTRIDPTHFAPADVVRGIYDLFGDRKVAYQGIAHLRRSDVKEEGGQYLLPERWSDGGWMRWRPLNASERLGLRVVLAWGMVEDRTGEDDPLVPVAPGSPTPATSALVLRALAHHGYTIGRR